MSTSLPATDVDPPSQKPKTVPPSALQDLLKGISTRADVHVSNWAFHLADKLRRAWFPLVGSPPFAAHRGEEALEYAALPTLDRWTPGLSSLPEQQINCALARQADCSPEACSAEQVRWPLVGRQQAARCAALHMLNSWVL